MWPMVMTSVVNDRKVFLGSCATLRVVVPEYSQHVTNCSHSKSWLPLFRTINLLYCL